MKTVNGTIMIALYGACLLAIIVMSPAWAEVTELREFGPGDLKSIISRSGVEIDSKAAAKGCLKMVADKPRVVRLFEISDVAVDNARLIYQARVKTRNVTGKVYLEMWCHFPGKGEYFSRGLQSTLSGTTNWTTEETSFFLKKGEKPDRIKLNLVIDGKGTAWIDDIRLLKAPLK
jgi:hypothetical protein